MVKKKEKKINIKTKKGKKIPVERTATPTVWNPFELFENMERFFMDDPWKAMGWRRRYPFIPWSEHWLETDTKMPPLDLVDTGNKYKIIAEIPGVSKKNLDVNITENMISICGETKTETEEENEGYIRHERSYSTICRNMAFPEEVNPDKAEATLKDGILEVKISKKTPTTGRGRKIPVK
jgi:HSP20 family protein